MNGANEMFDLYVKVGFALRIRRRVVSLWNWLCRLVFASAEERVFDETWKENVEAAQLPGPPPK